HRLPKREEEVGRCYGPVAIGQILEVNLAVGTASVRADGEESLIDLIAVRSSLRSICEFHPGGVRPVQERERCQYFRLNARACGSTGGRGHLHQLVGGISGVRDKRDV